MSATRLSGASKTALFATFLLAVGQVWRFPHLVLNGITGDYLWEASLEFPLTYTLLAPFSALADTLTFNSPPQHIVWGIYLLAGYWVAGRSIRGYLNYLGLLTAFLVWGALWPRPAVLIRPHSQEDLTVDFHSHSTRSHDGRRFPPAYTLGENIHWHLRQGYGASFLTDHNTFLDTSGSSRLALAGEELSLHDSHIIVLGNHRKIDNQEYSDGLPGIQRFLSEGEGRYGGLSVLSLPEYWTHHWARVETMIEWGADGIELINSAPKAIAFPEIERQRIISLARKHDVFLCGVSDSHGWGSATFTWNLLRIPRQDAMSPNRLQEAILNTLRKERFSAVRIATRIKHRPTEGLGMVFEPVLGLWTLLRTLSFPQAIISSLWFWLPVLLMFFSKKRKSREKKNRC